MNHCKSFLVAALVASTLIMTGCVIQPTQGRYQGYGPPPHAPAHGYRHKYQDHELVYDSSLGVYLVVGFPDYYFLDDSYYRHSNDGWYYSRQFDRDWQQYRQDKVPPGLAKKYHGNDRGHGHNKDRDDDDGHGNDKGRGHDNGRGNGHN